MTIRRGPDPTDNQDRYLEALRQLARDGHDPTSGEIALALGLQRYSANRQLQALEEMGLVEDVPVRVRSGRWRLTPAASARLRKARDAG